MAKKKPAPVLDPTKKVLVAVQDISGPYGRFTEGEVIPNGSVPASIVRQWLNPVVEEGKTVHPCVAVQGSEADKGWWNDEDPLNGLPENPLP